VRIDGIGKAVFDADQGIADRAVFRAILPSLRRDAARDPRGPIGTERLLAPAIPDFDGMRPGAGNKKRFGGGSIAPRIEPKFRSGRFWRRAAVLIGR
jgi:hypothetical protein